MRERAQHWLRARRAFAAGVSVLACASALAFLLPDASAQDLGIEQEVSDDEEMLLEADQLIYDNDNNTITAAGGVQIEYDGYLLVAERVTYDRNTSRLIASGRVELVQPDGTRIYSEEIDITDDFRDGFVQTLRVETTDAETAEKVYFGADSARREDGNVTTFNYGVYTACEPCEENPERPPIWRVKSQKIIWNGEEKTIRFEQARFELFGTPIAYLPYFVTADPTVERKSGFLIPSYFGNDYLGHGIQVPYYLALSPTYDLTLYGTGFTKQGFLGQAEWRQRFNNGEYSIRIAGIRQRNPDAFYEDPDNPTLAALRAPTRVESEEFRGGISTAGRFEINPRWTFGWDVLVQTDKKFAYDYEIPGYRDTVINSNIYLTGIDDRNHFDIRVNRFTVQEAIRDNNRDTGEPIATAANPRQPWVLPQLDYAVTAPEPVAGGELTFDMNLHSLYRERLDRQNFSPLDATGSDRLSVRGIEGHSTRLTMETLWKRTLIAPGGLALTPLGHLRGDVIGVSFSDESVAAINELALQQQVGADVRSAYYRYMATAGMEARWPVLFSTTSSTHILEPMGQLFVRPDAPFSDELGIPNEDAQSLVFDASNLFERDKFSGYDRIEGGIRANLGIRYSGTFGDGWAVNALFGQSFHLAGDNPFADPDLVYAGAYSGLETDRSDYVGSVGLVTPVGFAFGAGGRFDEQNWELRRTDLSSSYSHTRFSAYTRYSYIQAQPLYGFATDREEVRFGGSVNITENWRVLGAATLDMSEIENELYELRDTTLTYRSIGIAYDDECFSFIFNIAESINRYDGERSRSFNFGISLRTIGDFGTTSSSGFASNFQN